LSNVCRWDASVILGPEERHAGLAWRTLRWMLRDPPLQGPVARGHSLWSASEIAALRGRSLDEVVAPCARALCDEVCA